MNEPTLTKLGRASFVINWDDTIRVKATKTRQAIDGKLSAHLEIRKVISAEQSVLITTQIAYISSGSARATLAKQLYQKHEGISIEDWDNKLEDCYYLLKKSLDEGEPTEVLDLDGADEPLEYLIYPYIPKDDTTLIFGDGGQGKTYFALLMVMCCATPRTDIGYWEQLYIRPNAGIGISSLILDYETNRTNMKRRVQMLMNGTGLPDPMIHYRRCYLPLEDEVESIASYIKTNDIGFVVVDSAGMASKGETSKQEVCKNFMCAVRELGITSLVLTHQSKPEPGKPRSPYGSVYFRNQARSTWAINSEQDFGSNESAVILTHNKANDSRLFSARAFKVEFNYRNGTDPPVQISTCYFWKDPMTIESEDLRAGVGIKEKVLDAMITVITPKQLADATGVKEQSVRNVLNRYKGKLWNPISKDMESGQWYWAKLELNREDNESI